MKHSPEPWRIHRFDDWEVMVCDKDGAFLLGGNMEGPGSMTPEDAERTVACVNACQGINPEAVPALLRACKMLRKSIDKYAIGGGTPIADVLTVEVEDALDDALAQALGCGDAKDGQAEED